MNYYRLKNFSSVPLERTIRPPVWEGSRVECCFVDSKALDSLNKLVVGPIYTAQEIREAEVALRAFLFHDEVNAVTPGVFFHHQSDLKSKPFLYSTSLGGTSFPGIKELLNDSSYHVYQWIVENIYTFSDNSVESDYLSAHYAKRKLKLQKIRDEEKRPDYLKPTFWMSMELAEFENIASSEDDYYENVFLKDEALVSTFLMPLPRTGLANYLANAVYRRHQDKISRLNANKFFDVLDKSWETHRELIDYQLDISISPFIAIVLNRAEKRSDIAKEIIALREEFSVARKQLWELFDDTKLRNSSVSVTKRILGDIERDTKRIIPKAFSAGDNWFPINFKFLGRMIWLLNSGSVEGGINESFEKLSASYPGPFHTIDVAKIMSEQLGNIEWNHLCRKHFTHNEMERLSDWRWE